MAKVDDIVRQQIVDPAIALEKLKRAAKEYAQAVAAAEGKRPPPIDRRW
jgi:hypothetical protein